MPRSSLLVLWVLGVSLAGCAEYKEADSNASHGLTTSTGSSTSEGTGTEESAGSMGTQTAGTTGPDTTGTTSGDSTGVETSDTSGTSASSTTGSACSAPCDPKQPPAGLSCTETCEFDFSSVPQWYCSGGCTAIGEPLGGMSCDQPDADFFCKLRTGNPRSTAGVFWTQTAILDEPGFCCLDLAPELSLGPQPEFAIDDLCYSPTAMAQLRGHAAASVIVSEGLQCADP